MKYLLDTNACIAVLRWRPKIVAERLDAVVRNGHLVLLSTIVLHELWYGALNSSQVAGQSRHLSEFLNSGMELVPFDKHDAKAAGEIRAALESAGKRIGAFDTLIAAQCRRKDVTLVTANVREFSRIKGLRWEDWTRS
jgi:tRNA(fMet)-specific endonuclease VapC